MMDGLYSTRPLGTLKTSTVWRLSTASRRILDNFVVKATSSASVSQAARSKLYSIQRLSIEGLSVSSVGSEFFEMGLVYVSRPIGWISGSNGQKVVLITV